MVTIIKGEVIKYRVLKEKDKGKERVKEDDSKTLLEKQ
jgi:hypothetical protein